MLRGGVREAATLAPVRRPCTALAVLAAAVATLGLPATAPAADPVMPLDQVRPGMRCNGFSVVRGTTISAFDVEVVDVVRGEAVEGNARILVRVSGEAVDATGLGPGFSGSPVLCPGADGVHANIGAISETVGEYGGKLGLVTPIDQILAEPVDPPGATPAPGPAPAGTRSLAGPLTFSGLSEPVAAALRRAGRAKGRLITTAPARPRAAFGPVPLVPGAAMAVGIAGGDLNAGAIGTVAYVDGDRVWGLGHEVDGTGRRGLMLQDAYVYTVVNNPQGTQDASTYKLASAGSVLGTLTNDAPAGVVGRLGAMPRGYDLRIGTKDLDTGKVRIHQTRLTDERQLGEPSGGSALSTVGPVALAQAAYEALRGSPPQQSGTMCVRVHLRGRTKPLRFCNRYIGGGGPQSAGAPMVADLAEAAGILDSFRLGDLVIDRVGVDLHVRRDLRQAYLRSARAVSKVRRGRTARIRLTARKVRGGTVHRTVRVRIPRSLRRGPHELVLTGRPADPGGGLDELGEVLELTLGDEEPDDDPGPTTVGELADRFRGLHRYDGITARFVTPSGRRTPSRRVVEDPQLRFSGTARVLLNVR